MIAEHVEWIFKRLMLQGKVCLAVHFLTECSGGEVIDVRTTAHRNFGPLDCFVLDVLEEKHPSQCEMDRIAVASGAG